MNERNSPVVPTSGVVTLYGYGITARVDRGHLILEDGIGAARRHARLPRVGHGLKRLVVIGADGMVSLAALQWLADQNAAFVMLDRNGSVLAITGPVRSSDARLRRAQALADQSEVGLRIVRELIGKKLAGQEQVVREMLRDPAIAQTIAEHRKAVASAETIQTIRLLEAHAGAVYWSAWRALPITFPKNDLRRVPEHWRTFGTRTSPLSGSPRLAANPANAILNYLYALLESEARLAAAALGLDPGLGVLHADKQGRDSLASDLMEPVRPQVDALALDWIAHAPLRREWFFEERDGTCRLMGSFAEQLSESAPTWKRVVVPYAEAVARALSLMTTKLNREPMSAAPLSQQRRRKAHSKPSTPPAQSAPRLQNICRVCGIPIRPRRYYCPRCVVTFQTEQMVKAAETGHMTAHTDKAQALRADTQRAHAAAKSAWQMSIQPAWPTEETYLQKIQPRLAGITKSAIMSALGVCVAYAADIRRGRRRPHPRHWQTLAALVGAAQDQ